MGEKVFQEQEALLNYLKAEVDVTDHCTLYCSELKVKNMLISDHCLIQV